MTHKVMVGNRVLLREMKDQKVTTPVFTVKTSSMGL